MDGWALLIAVLALVVSGSALLIAWWQLVLQRDAAGGRGVIFDIRRLSRFTDNTTNPPTVTENYRVLVKTVGNDRHEVVVYLERDGVALDEFDAGYVDPLPVEHRLTCEDEPLVWKFGMDPELAGELHCVVLWVEPLGDGIRNEGFRRPLTSKPTEPQFEQWHWFRLFHARRRLENWAAHHGPVWFRNQAGRPHRLGEWRPYVLRPLQPGQSPRHSQATGVNEN
jgi:hypothetical protein